MALDLIDQSSESLQPESAAVIPHQVSEDIVVLTPKPLNLSALVFPSILDPHFLAVQPDLGNFCKIRSDHINTSFAYFLADFWGSLPPVYPFNRAYI